MLEFISSPGVRFPLSRAQCARLSRSLTKVAPVLLRGVSIAFVSKGEIQVLNKKYRGKNQPTDVLSFSYLDQNHSQVPVGFDFVGQMYISPEVIKEQAKYFKTPYRLECARMLVHGLLHCAGFDHLKVEEARHMFACQERIVRAAAAYLRYDVKNIPRILNDEYFKKVFKFPALV